MLGKQYKCNQTVGYKPGTVRCQADLSKDFLLQSRTEVMRNSVSFTGCQSLRAAPCRVYFRFAPWLADGGGLGGGGMGGDGGADERSEGSDEFGRIVERRHHLKLLDAGGQGMLARQSPPPSAN